MSTLLSNSYTGERLSSARPSTFPNWLREPLLHFVVLGALLFAVDHFIIGQADDPRAIAVDAAVDSQARQVFKTARGREPNEEELYALRRVWLDNEVLYREGLALGVDKGDTAIRERVIFKMLSIVSADLKLPPVDDDLLRGWFEQNRARYDEPKRYDFQEAVLSGDRTEPAVRAFVEMLHKGTPGELNAGLRLFKGRPHSNIVQGYGEEFAKALEESPVGNWRALPTHDGWRAVQLESITPPKPAAFENLRGVVLQDWTDAIMAERRTAAVRALAQKYTVKVEAAKMKGSLHGMLLVALALLSGSVAAHEMSMAEMELRQVSNSEFLWQWTASGSRPASDELKPVWPEGCSVESNVLRCGELGLRGKMAVEGVGKRYSAAMVKVLWLDGQTRVYTMTSAQPTARLYGSADDERGMGEIATAYTVLGVEHILSGIDHLLFVLALLFLVGFNRRLVWTITAFTVAHSLTLALSALGWVTLRAPPVEATIALSIVLVAGEALHRRPTLSRRWPALVAFLFGLVHGLGFAGALREIGLPQNHLSIALLTFNAGVEVGQLLVVGVAYLIYRILAGWPKFAIGRAPALYAIGSVAAYWSIGRIVSILA